MKNFARALRYAWPFRGRLLVSILCAVIAAGVWSLTLTTVWPIQKILTNRATLQQVVDDKINVTQENIGKEESNVNRLNHERKEHNTLPEGDFKNTQIRRN